ncbi:hypothetical protein BU23DRAFT_552902 [Bimuria novae-zelandiae CBS 107.79]|uniref:Uncharacterized protein n=1 Tax=Bimuria novae-zelandiae CBS 107.79 TaxID=1447943 RepID=A0A6A5VFB2_9PLEO|nr:hypothetical protein BU23DRAFT_552902 [Bimuria novae-zelandiae CBS 107.79]
MSTLPVNSFSMSRSVSLYRQWFSIAWSPHWKASLLSRQQILNAEPTMLENDWPALPDMVLRVPERGLRPRSRASSPPSLTLQHDVPHTRLPRLQPSVHLSSNNSQLLSRAVTHRPLARNSPSTRMVIYYDTSFTSYTIVSRAVLRHLMLYTLREFLSDAPGMPHVTTAVRPTIVGALVSHFPSRASATAHAARSFCLA